MYCLTFKKTKRDPMNGPGLAGRYMFGLLLVGLDASAWLFCVFLFLFFSFLEFNLNAT
jgi:hypothetical protein